MHLCDCALRTKYSYDCDEWLQGALEFGWNRFTDPDNPVERQMLRLSQSRSSMNNGQLDGTCKAGVDFWDTLQARAVLRSGSAGGADGNTADIYIELHFLAMARMLACFDQLARFGDDGSSPYWKILQFIGLPKSKTVNEFTDLRWICKSAVLHKLYLRSLRTRIREELRSSAVHSYGFRRLTSTSDLTALVRDLLFVGRL